MTKPNTIDQAQRLAKLQFAALVGLEIGFNKALKEFEVPPSE